MKKLLAGMAIAAGILIPAASASAHTPNVSHNCAGVSWNFTSYEHANATVTVDGSIVASKSDFQNWSSNYPWSQTANHTYIITIDDVGTQYDKTWNSTQTACQQATTTTAVTTTTAPATTTTSPPTSTAVTTTTVIENTTVPSTSPESTTASTPSDSSTSTTAVTPTSTASSTTVAVGLPPVPSTPTGGLPKTGTGDTVAMLCIATMLVSGGFLLRRKAVRAG